MKICHPGPSRWTDHVWEFDRFRTCDHQTHKLALYQLSYKLHVVAPEGIEPSLTEQKPVVLPLYHRAIYLRRLKDSNLWDVYRLLVFKTSAIDQLCQTSMVCDSWEIRTPDPDVRSVVLWSNWANEPNLAEAEGFEPSRPSRSSTLAEYRFRPLTHTSFLISSAKLRKPNAVFFRSWKNLQKFFKKMHFSLIFSTYKPS